MGLLCALAQELADANAPGHAVQVMRLDRLTALRKQDGGVRGIVAGDVLRPLVARALAQQVGTEVEEATVPHQYTLSTHAGTECVAHVLQALTAQDAAATVVSIDGIGAFDSVSRAALVCGSSVAPVASAPIPHSSFSP